MAFRWRADDGSLIVVFRSYLLLLTNKNAVKVSGSAHAPCTMKFKDILFLIFATFRTFMSITFLLLSYTVQRVRADQTFATVVKSFMHILKPMLR